MKKINVVKIGILTALVFTLFSAEATAQYGVYRLSSGTTVAIKTEIVPPGNGKVFENAYSSVTDYRGEIVHRVMFDSKSKTYFGYDLAVEKIGETGKFKVEVKPLSKTLAKLVSSATTSSGETPDYKNFTEKSLPKYPEAVTIDDSDTITLDILENRKTNTKISDFIKITAKPNNFFEPYFSERTKSKDFTLDEVNLIINYPKILVNGQTIKDVGGSASGNIVWISIPGKCRFIFSFRPQPQYNFQKTGMILDNKIVFDYNGESYEFINKSPVLGSGGKWNLWVMFDESYKPAQNLSPETPFSFGAADKAEYLFDNK